MKHNTTINKSIIAIMGITLMLTSCSTWHYNKQQRIRIEGENIPYSKVQSDPKEMTKTSTVLSGIETEQVLVNDATIRYGEQENLKVKKGNEQKSTVVGSIIDTKTQSTLKLLADQFKRHDKKVCKTQHVEKTELSGWVRIMIILFVVGFILLLLGIFLSIFLHPGFWWLFYFFGSLCILAGFIVLILGLVGVI